MSRVIGLAVAAGLTTASLLGAGGTLQAALTEGHVPPATGSRPVMLAQAQRQAADAVFRQGPGE
jgi:hypothetical protein